MYAGDYWVMPCTVGLSRQNDIWLQDAIRRVQDLEKMGHLSGVMDDRGKVSQHLFWFQLHVVIVHNTMSQRELSAVLYVTLAFSWDPDET